MLNSLNNYRSYVRVIKGKKMDRNEWFIWDCVNEETRGKLKKHLPKGWKPPKLDKRDINGCVESVEEIGRLMRQAPKEQKQEI